jgi:hypothetical protein
VHSHVHVLFQGCMIEIKEMPPRQLGALFIDKSFAWRFFDGAKRGPPNFCNLGGLHFIFERHILKFEMGLGHDSNNLVELMVLRSLLKLANEKGVRQLQVTQP